MREGGVSAAETGSTKPGRSVLLAVLVLAGLGLLTTAGCLTAPPFSLDDDVLVFGNPLVCGERAWWEAFTGFHYYQYIPLTSLSYRLNALVFGLDATWSFRLVNWLLHSSSAVILWRLFRLLGWSPRCSLFAACAWAVHPLACETVAWISERSNALSFLFGTLSLWAYVKWHGQWRGVAWAAVAFAAALLSKPLALGWLPVFAVLEVLGGPRKLAGADGDSGSTAPPPGKAAPGTASATAWRHVKPAILRLFPLIVLAIGFVELGVRGYETADRPPPGGTWFTALLTDADLFLRYVWNVLVPVDLSAMYSVHAITSLADIRLWQKVAVWAGLVGGSVALAGSRRRALFGWLWFLGGLGPACNVIAIGYPMQDRYIYLSSAGLLLVLAEVSAGIAERGRTQGRLAWAQVPAAGAVLGAIYIGSLVALTIERAPLWGDAFSLMKQAVDRQPEGVLPHIFFADELERLARKRETGMPGNDQTASGLHRAAVRHLTTAIAQRDAYIFDRIPAQVRLARSLSLTGKPREAAEVLDQSHRDLQLLSKDGGAHAVIPTEPSGHPYLLPVAKLGDMHLCLGEAYLAWAVNSRGKEALEFYNRAMANAQSAIQLNVLRYQTNKLLALGFLFQEAFGDGSQEALGVARGRLAVATKQLEAMGREREILSAFNQPASPARVQSLACLAMSRAALKTARQAKPANGDPADLAESLQSSLDWAQRAADLDPELGEAFWLQALAYQVLGDWLNTTNRSTAARARNDCIKALKAIQPGSPRYAQARNLLAAMAP